MGAVAAVLMAGFIVLNAFALSGEQLAERNVGDTDYSVLALTIPAGTNYSAIVTAAARSLSANGATSTSVQLLSFDMSVEGMVAGLSTGPQDVVQYREQLLGSLPPRYKLISGRWPSASDEVAISPRLASLAGSPTSLSVFAGASHLRVVGVMEDKFATSGLVVLGGAGLWRDLDGLEKGFPGTSAQLEVGWSGAGGSKILDSLSASLGTPVDQLQNALQVREFYLARGQRSLTERSPALFWGPVTILLSLAAVAAQVAPLRRLRREVGAMERLGMSRRQAAAAAAVVASIIAGLSAVCGIGLGLAIGGLVRVMAIPRLLSQPMSPMPPLVAASFGICVIVIFVTFLVVIGALGFGGGERNFPVSPAPPRARFARFIAGVASSGAALYLLPGAMSVADGITIGLLLTAILVLALPEMMQLLMWVQAKLLSPLAARRITLMIAQRVLWHERRQLTVIAVASAVCLSVPVSVLTLIASVQTSQAAEATVSLGQLKVANPSGPEGLPDGLLGQLRRDADLSAPVDVRRLQGQTEGGGKSVFGIMVVKSTDDLNRLNGSALTAGVAEALERGALLEFGDSGTLGVRLDDGRLLEPETVHMTFDRSWSLTFGGVVLEKTVQHWRGKMVPEAQVFTGVDARQIDVARKVVAAHHLSPTYLAWHQEPDPPPIEWPFWLLGAGLLTVGLLVVGALCAGAGRRMRRRGAQFLSLGLPASTPSACLALQLALLGMCVGPLVVITAIGPTLLLGTVRQGLELHAPPLLVPVATSALAIIGATGIFAARSGMVVESRVDESLA